MRKLFQGAWWGLMAGLLTGIIRIALGIAYPAPSCGPNVVDDRPGECASLSECLWAVQRVMDARARDGLIVSEYRVAQFADVFLNVWVMDMHTSTSKVICALVWIQTCVSSIFCHVNTFAWFLVCTIDLRHVFKLAGVIANVHYLCRCYR